MSTILLLHPVIVYLFTMSTYSGLQIAHLSNSICMHNNTTQLDHCGGVKNMAAGFVFGVIMGPVVGPVLLVLSVYGYI